MEINPYAPAAPVVANSHPPRPIVESIHFDGLVHRSDVMALGRSDRGGRIARAVLYFSITGFAMFAIFVFALAFLKPSTSPTAAFSFRIFFSSFFILPFLILVPLFLISRMRGGNYAKRALKISPRMVGPLAGKIDNETVELRYLHYHSITPIDSLTGVRITPEVIGFTVDARRLFISVLPKHIFQADDFERVAARLEQIAIERPLVSQTVVTEDKRLMEGEPLVLLSKPDGGIAFTGILSHSDLKATPIFIRQMRKFFFFNLILVLVAVLFPLSLYHLFSDMDSLGVLVFISIASLPLFIAVGKRLLIYRQYRKMPDTEITKLQGWVAKDNVTINSTIGSFAYLKNSFIKVESDDKSIQCLMSGQLKQVVLLPRRFFSNDADYEAAARYLHSSITL